jgi:hypothetical protein
VLGSSASSTSSNQKIHICEHARKQVPVANDMVLQGRPHTWEPDRDSSDPKNALSTSKRGAEM